jgi:RNA polymerase sigma factor (sigma-70 family)
VTTSSFEDLYRRHYGDVLSSCRHILRSRDDAEDAAQQTFLSAYRDLVRGVRPAHPKAWLYGIARNRCLEILRNRQRSSAPNPSSSADVVEEIERRAEIRELLEDLKHLPPAQRMALALFELRALSQADIACVLDCKPARVKALVFQARSALLADREARETPCAEIRALLATQRGSALRARTVRVHLRHCRGCADFHHAIRDQRQGIASLRLVPIPVLALKEKLLAAIRIGRGDAVSDAASTLPQAAAVKVALLVITLSGVAITEQVIEGSGNAPEAVRRSAPDFPSRSSRPTFASAPRSRTVAFRSEQDRASPSWTDAPTASTWQGLLPEPQPADGSTAPGGPPGMGEDPGAAASGAGRGISKRAEGRHASLGRGRNDRSAGEWDAGGSGRGQRPGNPGKGPPLRTAPDDALGKGPLPGGGRYPSRRDVEKLLPEQPSQQPPLDQLEPSPVPAAPGPPLRP